MAHVLIADDDSDIADLVAAKLVMLGHEVRVVHDGRLALAEARTNVYDLLVLDVSMPVLSGLDLTLIVRADPYLSRTPVVLLSASAFAADVENGLRAGADDYVTKPFSPRELGARVEALLQRVASDSDVAEAG